MKSAALYWVLGVVGLVLFAAIYWIEININPVVKIPPAPPMPSPNAFDSFVAVGRLEVRGGDVDDATSSFPTRARTTSEKQALLAANASALAALQHGLALPYVSPPVRSMSESEAYLTGFRAVCRLLRFQSKVKASEGDWTGALASDMESIQVGETVPHCGTILHRLVGDACQAIGRKDIWSEIDHIPAPAARKAALSIQDMQASQFPLGQSIEKEKWLGECSLLEFFGHRGWTGSVVYVGMWSSYDTGPNTSGALRCLLTSKRAVVAHYARYMDRMIERSNLSYASNSKLPDVPPPPDPISQMLVVEIGRCKDTDNDTQNDLLATTLALHAYRVDHSAYPRSLAQLVPIYLREVPRDRFAASGPLHYRRAGANYVVYSVGPDGVDNGGKPIYSTTTPGGTPVTGSNRNEFVEPDSKGDIVAGININ